MSPSTDLKKSHRVSGTIKFSVGQLSLGFCSILPHLLQAHASTMKKVAFSSPGPFLTFFSLSKNSTHWHPLHFDLAIILLPPDEEASLVSSTFLPTAFHRSFFPQDNRGRLLPALPSPRSELFRS